jgi:uncharacterized protein with PIN domain
MDTRPRFIAAPPLGRLSRWLRTLGFDCVYLRREQRPSADRDDAEAIYITRHADPAGRHVIFIGQDRVFDQLKVMDMLIRLKGRCDPLTRCIRCNTALVDVGRKEACGRVPEYVLQSHDRFSGCPSCGRIYWPGTHVDRMEERIAALFG